MNKIERIESTKVSGVYYVAIREGQIDPSQGNDVEVSLAILVPIKRSGHSYEINPELQFGKRVILMGEPLTSHWGNNVDDEYRSYEKVFSAPKWAKAFRLACEYGDAEISKLRLAIEERQKALAEAEGEEVEDQTNEGVNP